MILVVDMNWKKNSLAYNEFVLPIVSAIEPLDECTVTHFSDIRSEDLGGFSRIVLSGTTLKDFSAQQAPQRFNWIKNCGKPILGICAGMQIISLVYGVPLKACLKIGMTQIATTHPNPLFAGIFQAYTLHSYSVACSETFEVLARSSECIQAIKHRQKPIYGVLFHPEVRNQGILHNFVRQT